MKFGLSFEKKNATSMGTVRAHNERLHPTKSQLPKAAWFTKQGMHVLMPWRKELMQEVKDLSVRKDSILAIELSIQVGNQTEWRDEPTDENPCGKPMATDLAARLKALTAAAQAAVFDEFGKDRVVSMVLHTDESTPHVQVVVVPIRDGKLDAKHWTGGFTRCEQLRERMHAAFSKHVPCDYERGAPGGAPIDKTAAAGGPKARQPKPTGVLGQIKQAIDQADLVKALKKEISGLQQQLQRQFGQLKRAHLQAVKEREKREAETAHLKEIERQASDARHRIKLLETEVARIAPYAPAKPSKAVPSGLPPKGQGTGSLKPPAAPGEALRRP